MAGERRRKNRRQIAGLPLSGCLTTDEVCRIHDRLCEDFAESDDPISPPGVRSDALLESAVGRQETGWGPTRKYPTAIANAATLTFGLTNDHPFHNGNKRTALVAMLAHLDRNRLTLFETRQSELFSLMLDVAQGTLSLRGVPVRRRETAARPEPDAEVGALADWLSRRTRAVTRGERDMTFRQLRQVLRPHGFTFESPDGNTISVVKHVEARAGLLRRKTITRPKRIGSIPFPGENKLVGVSKIKRIRRMCDLTEEDGVDSDAFYEGADAIDVFINEYRTVLRRLARR